MLERANQIKEQLIAWRRDFHAHPELGFQEIRTAGRVAQVMESLGYRVRTCVGRTGVVAERGQSQPLIAIRADMDALPIREANPVPYASQDPGVMHACGHDAHTAMALGAAALLAAPLPPSELPGTVRFLFQPAEEVGDAEGVSGAPRMIADGAIQGASAVLALHVDPTLPVGEIAVGPGPSSAGVDTFYATILGQGGHGAMPHKAVDPIHIAGLVILALHGIVSRRLHPFEPAVVTIGSIHGGSATNVIPDGVDIAGTLRFMEPEVREQIHQGIERALEVARAMGGDYRLRFETGYPPMFNDPGMAALVRDAAADLLGAESVRIPERHMGAEDFGFFCSQAPGVMFSLGCRIEGDERQPHHPLFDINEGCLPVGAALLAEIAMRFLRGNW